MEKLLIVVCLVLATLCASDAVGGPASDLADNKQASDSFNNGKGTVSFYSRDASDLDDDEEDEEWSYTEQAQDDEQEASDIERPVPTLEGCAEDILNTWIGLKVPIGDDSINRKFCSLFSQDAEKLNRNFMDCYAEFGWNNIDKKIRAGPLSDIQLALYERRMESVHLCFLRPEGRDYFFESKYDSNVEQDDDDDCAKAHLDMFSGFVLPKNFNTLTKEEQTNLCEVATERYMKASEDKCDEFTVSKYLDKHNPENKNTFYEIRKGASICNPFLLMKFQLPEGNWAEWENPDQ